MTSFNENEPTTLESKIHASAAGKSLIEFLTSRFRYHSPDEWRALIVRASVRVNGQASVEEHPLVQGDIVSYTVVLREPPVDRDISIIHEEDTFLVANKPGNLPSHADGNFIKNTFIYILNETLRARGFTGKANLVHRLDRETSGLLVVSKEARAHRALTGQFETGSVGKEYLAVARGVVAEDRFEVGGAIARDTDSSISIRRRVVPEDTPDSSPSKTLFEVEERLRGATLIRCRPLTGRTNQIRIHLAHAGHPLIGDKLYGRSDTEFLEFVRRARAGDASPLPWLEAPRHLLHAQVITFTHPERGDTVRFEAALPPDMRTFIEERRGQ